MNAEELRLARAKYAAFQDANLVAGKEAAYELGSSMRVWDDKNEVRAGAVRLLELANLTASLVERYEREHPEVVREAAKKFPWFPIPLSSAGGRDTKEKLKLIRLLPIGENWPFKRFAARAQNDDLWQLIEATYNQFQGLRLSPTELFPVHEMRDEVLQLPELCKATAGTWTDSFAKYLSSPFLNSRFPIMGSFSVDTTKEEEKRRSGIVEQMQKEFGGTKLEIDESKEDPEYFSQTEDGTRIKELDAIRATRLQEKMKAAQQGPTEDDKQMKLKKMIHTRLLDRLKK